MARFIRSSELLLTVRVVPALSVPKLHNQPLESLEKLQLKSTMSNCYIAVKFEGQDQLPPILNALETDNGGNKLILEVAVRKSIY